MESGHSLFQGAITAAVWNETFPVRIACAQIET